MKIFLIKNNRIWTYKLPKIVKDNFWITDLDSFNNRRNLINVEAFNNNWILKSNYETQIVSSNQIFDEIKLDLYSFYTIKNDNEKGYYYIYCSPNVESNINKYQIIGNGTLTIGSNSSNNISYNNLLLDDIHCKLTYENNKWTIFDNNAKFKAFVNDEALVKSKVLNNGDIVFIAGLKIIVLGNIIIINNINNKVIVNSSLLVPMNETINSIDNSISKEEELDRNLYQKEDYFYRSPRFIEDIKKEDIVIEDPPPKISKEETPIIMTIGPMFTMAITSLTTVIVTLNNIMNGETTWKNATPSLAISGAMFCTMLVWPLISRIIERKKRKKKEDERKNKYNEYISNKENEVSSIIKRQSQTLKDKYIGLSDCANIIIRKKSNLWERGINQDDFLTLRLGIGNMPLFGEFKYSKEKFTLDEDELKKKVYDLVNENNILDMVPITFSLTEKFVTSIIGESKISYEFFKGLLLQMITYHSYESLKLVILTNRENENNWNYIRDIPYLFSDDKLIRFFANNIDETKELSLYLEKIYQERKNYDKDSYKNYKDYYVIITDNYHYYRDIEIIKDILSQNKNVGFSLIIFSEKLHNLPSECQNFISVGNEKSGIFESEINNNHQKEFNTEFCNIEEFNLALNKISNIPIDLETEDKQLPGLLSFLEMYQVGKVEQLNIEKRWSENVAKKSLAVPIGIEKSGSLLKLDLHEKYHGPHGLIAGMTGSGKSELIITYVLSLAVNFSPEEVSFILIDYKGGGLAGAFENRESGYKLPHLAGTITNLDTKEMNRSLVSIESELRRRQQIFNSARDRLGESTVDIYKYQDFYKNGLVKEAVPHLLIICDEFAELKSQQPEFMDQLISIARIGRSLGIHLILATQKPSGVVNDQIWSNSRFRICLKVQEKNDSNEMIKCPDAALLKNVGRFYLQVGYNELFALGQSAWAGKQYYPKEVIKKKIDQSIIVIDDIGNIINKKESDNNLIIEESRGEELSNILKYIIDTSNKLNLKANTLWLPRMGTFVTIDSIINTFNYHDKEFVLNPLIGIYDDPSNQKQGLVTMNLTKDGNTIIYGSSGTGKELLLSTMIYSLIKEHKSEEVNLYVVDCGSGTLKMYSEAPHVGDVILGTNEEKVSNLFKAINGEIDKRKSLFANFNGNFNSYNKSNQNKLPYIVVVINNFDAFLDLYDYSDIITKLSRDSVNYGIIFVISANNTGTIRYKLKQNFKGNIVLQFNDRDDYSLILGNTKKLFPANVYGRGLVKMDNIYEFQTAYIKEMDKVQEYILDFTKKLANEASYKASSVPVVPEMVNVNDYIDKIESLSKVPIGIGKLSVSTEYIDLYSNYSYLISALELDKTINFVESLSIILKNVKNNEFILFDNTEKLNIESTENFKVIHENSVSMIDELYDMINEQKYRYTENNYNNKIFNNINKKYIIINNFDKFLDSLPNKDKLIFIIENSKELGTLGLILIDSTGNLKKHEFDIWYKNNISMNNGIWIGPGLKDQGGIRANLSFRDNYDNLEDNFGIIVKNGSTTVVKLIEKGVEIV